jgi:hypothetical protein
MNMALFADGSRPLSFGTYHPVIEGILGSLSGKKMMKGFGVSLGGQYPSD